MVVEGTQRQGTPAWDWLDGLGSKVRDAYDSFVIRAPKITLRSSTTVRRNTNTTRLATQHPHLSVGGSSPAISFESSTPSSCATARDHLTNDSKRRLVSRHPPPIAEEEEEDKIAVRAAILALRLAVSCAGQLESGEPTQESAGRRLSIHDEKIRESRLRREQVAALALLHPHLRRLSIQSSDKAVEQAPGRLSGDHFQRRGALFVAHRSFSRRNTV